MKNWSLKMAECVLNGYPDISEKWSCENGIVLKGILNIWRKTGGYDYFNFCREYIDKNIFDNGMLREYMPYDYNIEALSNGKILIEVYKQIRNEKYKKAIFKLRKQLYKHPRTRDGVFWLKKTKPNRIFIENLYMCCPFYSEYINSFEREKRYGDIIRQFLNAYKHLQDEETGLLYHSYSERCEYDKAEEQQTSKVFWGRGIGFFVMAISDTLDILPKFNKNRYKIAEMLKNCLEALAKFQDKSGCWYQVLNQGERKGNYLEASCSCMFLYAMVKAYKRGYIGGESWKEIITNAYNGIIDEFVTITKDGNINLNKNCLPTNDLYKDENDSEYSYYISMPIVCNDLTGVGAFILAMLEYESLR